MNQLFNPDNKFFQGVSKVMDCIWVSILWLVCSLPIFTIGASTTALYYTAHKCLRYDRGYATSEFFRAFKSNFKQATIVWLIMLVVYAILGIDYYVMQQYAIAGEKIGVLYLVFLGFGIIVSIWWLYIFPYMARFANTTKNVFSSSLYMAVANIHWTIVLVVIVIACCLGMCLFAPVIIIMPVLYNLLKDLVLERVFLKYMKPEDIEKEKERNRDFYN